MALDLYMDVHIPRPITDELRRRGVNVLTAQEDGTATIADPLLLDRATRLNRVLVTSDLGFLAEATRRQRTGIAFAGIIHVPDKGLSIGRRIEELELVAKASEISEAYNRVAYLPL